MKAVDLIDEFFAEKKLDRLDNVNQLVFWLEQRLGKKMNRPLIFSKGCGGGQTYRVFWNTFDNLGNRNIPSYYFLCKGAKVPRLNANFHLQLQVWIDSVAETVMD
jgi:hypothetical protein